MSENYTWAVRISVGDGMTWGRLSDLLDLAFEDVDNVHEFAIDGRADEPLETLSRANERSTT